MIFIKNWNIWTPQNPIGKRRSFSYGEAKKIYIEGLAIGQLVERGGLPDAEKFEEMLYRMNYVRENLKDKKNRNMENVPSAEYFIEYMLHVENNETIVSSPRKLSYILTEFAKLHVEAQQKAILESAEVNILNKSAKNPKVTLVEVDKESIKNAYPLENIK